jgi:hypothetical protein
MARVFPTVRGCGMTQKLYRRLEELEKISAAAAYAGGAGA